MLTEFPPPYEKNNRRRRTLYTWLHNSEIGLAYGASRAAILRKHIKKLDRRHALEVAAAQKRKQLVADKEEDKGSEQRCNKSTYNSATKTKIKPASQEEMDESTDASKVATVEDVKENDSIQTSDDDLSLNDEFTDICPEYQYELDYMYKNMMDGLVSAVHRNIPFYHANRTSYPPGYHVTTDEEETQLNSDLFTDSEDTDDEETSESDEEESKKREGGGSTSGQQKNSMGEGGTKNGACTDTEVGEGGWATSGTTSAERAKKNVEAQRKRRQEEDNMLLKTGQVFDDKGNLLNTFGPFPSPRLKIRSAKPTMLFPSRKMLQQRLRVEDAIDFDELSEGDTPGEKGAIATCASPSQTSGGETGEEDAITLLSNSLQRLSIDSLKKMSESAKIKMRGNQPHSDFVEEITKKAVCFGYDKVTILADRHHSILNAHANLVFQPTMEYLRSLPAELKANFISALELSDYSTEVDMWERVIAMGFLCVLNNLKLRPLKKITQEIGLPNDSSTATEKYCENIVFCVFPKEKKRSMDAKKGRKMIGVAFTLVPDRMTCLGNRGIIGLKIINASKIRHESERHYSPEFEFGEMRWSLLCMANKDALALYLCQTGSVYCKFYIRLINKDAYETIGNEGIQRFSAESHENDWGFNAIIKFDKLFNPANGFWDMKEDSIEIEIGILYVEPMDQRGATGSGGTGAIGNIGAGIGVNNNDKKNLIIGGNIASQDLLEGGLGSKDNGHDKAIGSGVGGSHQKNAKQSKNAQYNVALHAAQLLEQERLEKEKKKIRQLLTNTIKEEERTRKELQQRGIKVISDVVENQRKELKRIQKAQADAKRREQAERALEQERVQRAQTMNEEMKRKVTLLNEEISTLQSQKKSLSDDVEMITEEIAKVKEAVTGIEKEIEDIQRQFVAQEKAKKEKEALLEQLKSLDLLTPPALDIEAELGENEMEGAGSEDDMMMIPLPATSLVGNNSLPSYSASGGGARGGGGGSGANSHQNEKDIMDQVRESIDALIDHS